MSTPTNTALFWACIHPDTVLTEWERLPEKLRTAIETGSLEKDYGLQFIRFKTTERLGIGLPISGFAFEQVLKPSKFVSEAGAGRAKVIRILEQELEMQNAGELVEIYPTFPERADV